MSSITDQIQEFQEASKSYIETTIEFHRLRLFKGLTLFLSSSVHKLLSILFITLSAIFLSTALAFLLGEIWESYAMGFFAVGTFYFIIFLLVLLLTKKKIETNVIQRTSKKFFN